MLRNFRTAVIVDGDPVFNKWNFGVWRLAVAYIGSGLTEPRKGLQESEDELREKPRGLEH